MLFWLSETGQIWGFQAFSSCSVDFPHYCDTLAEIGHIWGFWALSGEREGVNVEGRAEAYCLVTLMFSKILMINTISLAQRNKILCVFYSSKSNVYSAFVYEVVIWVATIHFFYIFQVTYIFSQYQWHHPEHSNFNGHSFHSRFLFKARFFLQVLSLPAFFCVCVCVHVRTITHHPFKLGLPNLDLRIKIRGAHFDVAIQASWYWKPYCPLVIFVAQCNRS